MWEHWLIRNPLTSTGAGFGSGTSKSMRERVFSSQACGCMGEREISIVVRLCWSLSRSFMSTAINYISPAFPVLQSKTSCSQCPKWPCRGEHSWTSWTRFKLNWVLQHLQHLQPVCYNASVWHCKNISAFLCSNRGRIRRALWRPCRRSQWSPGAPTWTFDIWFVSELCSSDALVQDYDSLKLQRTIGGSFDSPIHPIRWWPVTSFHLTYWREKDREGTFSCCERGGTTHMSTYLSRTWARTAGKCQA